MNKEQFIEELKSYLYKECARDYSPEEIDDGIDKRSNGIQGYLNLVEDNEYESVEEALKQAKEDFRLIFSILTYEEFKQEVIKQLQTIEPSIPRTREEVEKIIGKGPEYIDIHFKKAKESNDYFHEVGFAVSNYYYAFMY